MGARVAKPIERLLKIKSIDPNFTFVGADKKAYEEFIERQKQETLLSELKEKEEKKAERKAKRAARKVKQVIPEDIVETGETQAEAAMFQILENESA